MKNAISPRPVNESGQSTGTPQEFIDLALSDIWITADMASERKLSISQYGERIPYICSPNDKESLRDELCVFADVFVNHSDDPYADPAWDENFRIASRKGPWDEWWKGFAFCNPPFKYIPLFLDAATESFRIKKKIITNSVFLIPASVGSNWYKTYIQDVGENLPKENGAVRVVFLNPRIKFKGHTAPFPKDLMLVLYLTSDTARGPLGELPLVSQKKWK